MILNNPAMAASTVPLQEHCIALFETGIAAADPAAAIKRCIAITGEDLQIGLNDKTLNGRQGQWPVVHLIAFGKAACTMIGAARNALPAEKLSGIQFAVTTYDNKIAIPNIMVMGAGHPLPDANGVLAANQLRSLLQQTRPGELVLTLISGGGSALLPCPVEGISLEDKIATTQLLLSSGADIRQINYVRKHLSASKGGGLVKWAAPADLHALILSDVIGDDVSAIASGPCVPDNTHFADAIRILETHQVWEQLPETVKHHLLQGKAGMIPETPKPGDPIFDQTGYSLIGSNSQSIAAVELEAQRLGYQTHLFPTPIIGEARLAAQELTLFAKHLLAKHPKQPLAVIGGGETTVTVKGNGRGGRNQEMALAFALAVESMSLPADWTFLSGGTDGRDGPTPAAGGRVDALTLSTLRDQGIDPWRMLQDNDAFTALQAADALVITGSTGTNVADLQILLLHPYFV